MTDGGTPHATHHPALLASARLMDRQKVSLISPLAEKWIWTDRIQDRCSSVNLELGVALFYPPPCLSRPSSRSSPAFPNPRRHHSRFNNHLARFTRPQYNLPHDNHPPAYLFTPRLLTIHSGTTRKLRLLLLRF